jgi:hypothetical protein
MQLVDTIYVIAIAVLYYMFASRTVNYVYDRDGNELEKCEYPQQLVYGNIDKIKQDAYKACSDRRMEEEKAINTRVFRGMMLIGVVTLVLSSQFTSGLIGGALPLASLFIILRSLIAEWSNMDEISKLVILGSGLAISMYGAHVYVMRGSIFPLMY